MKLSALFARYLYQHKELSLPGIGLFSIGSSVTIPDATDKNFNDFFQHIKYEQKPVLFPDEALINFIRTETGKIKPLAESDLDSFLSDGKILLNIGKPFHIDGIGSLTKTKSGAFEFKPGDPTLPKLEGFYNNSNHDEGIKKKSPYGNEYTQNNDSRKLAVAAALIGGLIFIVWGGYMLYNRNAVSKSETVTPVITTSDTVSNANVILDSAQKIINSSREQLQRSSSAAAGYKFIIERTANKSRALKRFQQLKDNGADIKMESNDSTLFALYVIIPASPSDTSRIKDSLKTWYGRKKIFIEPN